MANRLLRHFVWHHLKPELQLTSGPCCELAELMDARLPESAEKTAGLRKLLEAKDCFVRAALEAEYDAEAPQNLLAKAADEGSQSGEKPA